MATYIISNDDGMVPQQITKELALTLMQLMWDGVIQQDPNEHNMPYEPGVNLKPEEALEWLKDILIGKSYLSSILSDTAAENDVAIYSPCLRSTN